LFGVMKRRQLGICGLLLFVVGTVIIPVIHKWEISSAHHCAAGDAYHTCCSHEHSADRETPGPSRNTHPTKKPHDPSICTICQLAKMPVEVATVGIPVPNFEPLEIALPFVPQQPEYKTPRLLPFSCGPPV
jgi:hypothetical protein